MHATQRTVFMQGLQCTQEVANDVAGICHVILACVKLEACFGPNINLVLHA